MHPFRTNPMCSNKTGCVESRVLRTHNILGAVIVTALTARTLRLIIRGSFRHARVGVTRYRLPTYIALKPRQLATAVPTPKELNETPVFKMESIDSILDMTGYSLVLRKHNTTT